MGKIYRFHAEGGNGEDWFESSEMHSNSIDQIDDPGRAKKEITSIPTPFARIDLVNKAFDIACKQGLNGDTIYHKMVADALDLGEILFNADRYLDRLSVVNWNKNENLQSLENGNEGQKLIGNTLKLFFDQDADQYNFDDLDDIHIIKIDGKVVGGTSPISLFFTTANNNSNIDIKFGTNRVFDDIYDPLHERSGSYILYLFWLREEISGFRHKFNTFSKYLDATFQFLRSQGNNQDLVISITKVMDGSQQALESVVPLTINDAGNVLKILGNNLYKRKDSEFNSDFIIASEKVIVGKAPLVLLNEFSPSKRLQYDGSSWESTFRLESYSETPLNERRLPISNRRHPYLVISDLLEPYLVKVPYKFNQVSYQVFCSEENHSYLTPVKPAFFEYFKSNKLEESIGGQKLFEMEELPGGVRVLLRVPIKGGFIPFERFYIYKENVYTGESDIKDGATSGEIIDQKWSMAITPPIVLSNNGTAENYKAISVMFSSSDLKPEFNLKEISDNNNNNNADSLVTHSFDDHSPSYRTDYWTFTNCNMFKVEFSRNVKALVIPKFNQYLPGSQSFKFAIDFGTSNTHLEYRVNGQPQTISASIENKDAQIAATFAPTTKIIPVAPELIEIIREKLLPIEFGSTESSELLGFPQRTLLTEPKNVNWNQQQSLFAGINIPFLYGRRRLVENDITNGNLKWSNYTNEAEAEGRVTLFLEELLFIMRNKVVLNGGNLNKTEIVTFYPSSMTLARRGALSNTWNILINSYFGPAVTNKMVSESLAPFFYYKNKGITAAIQTAVSLDIGGETVDILAFRNNSPVFISSVRYGAKAMFGDGYSNTTTNGFIERYSDIVEEKLTANNFRLLKGAKGQIEDNLKDSIDLIDYFFSLEKSTSTRGVSIISFGKLISGDPKFKSLVLVYTASIFWHIAKLCRLQNIDIPKNILCSGNGSKIFNILDPSPKSESLKTLISQVFNIVYGNSDFNQIDYHSEENPKIITAKGGLFSDNVDLNLEEKKIILLGDNESTILTVDKTQSYKESVIGKEKELGNKVAQEVNKFINDFNTIDKVIKFKDKFDIEPNALNQILEIIEENAAENTAEGISRKLLEIGDNVEMDIEESLFFLPFIGGLNKAAYLLANE